MAGQWELSGDAINRAADSLCGEVDASAGAARTKFMSGGEFIEQEYLETYSQAKAYVDGGYAGPAPATVQSWARAKKKSNKEAADDIIAAREHARTKMEAIRDARLTRRENIRAIAAAGINQATGEAIDPAALDQMIAERDMALQDFAAI